MRTELRIVKSWKAAIALAALCLMLVGGSGTSGTRRGAGCVLDRGQPDGGSLGCTAPGRRRRFYYRFVIGRHCGRSRDGRHVGHWDLGIHWPDLRNRHLRFLHQR